MLANDFALLVLFLGLKHKKNTKRIVWCFLFHVKQFKIIFHDKPLKQKYQMEKFHLFEKLVQPFWV